MKLAENTATMEGVGLANEMDFGIARDGLPLILNILRNKMYSNKILAVERELSCNAMDAMVEAGKSSQPIKVTLPNDLNPVFKVRDYGKALTPDELRSIFVQYGASTKRGSNAYIGQMGIGAKSPFAYTDSFVVSSYQGGVCRTYTAFIDPSQVGKMTQLGEDMITDEEDGLEVIVTVREDDIERFYTEAIQFFKYWKVRPIFEGRDVQFDTVAPLFSSDNGDWIIPTSKSSCVAIMGNVPYELDQYAINLTGSLELRGLFHTGFQAWFNIGDLEVSASRESLEYTPTTNKAIIAKLQEVQASLAAVVNKKIETAISLYDAKRLYRDITKSGGPLAELQSCFTKVTYKGNPVTSSYFECQEPGVEFENYQEGTRLFKGHYRAAATATTRIMADPAIPIIFNDIDATQHIINRLAPAIQRDVNPLGKRFETVVLITVTNKENWDKWVKESGYDAPMHNLSEFPKVPLSELYPTVPGVRNASQVNPKHSCKVFEFGYESSSLTMGRRYRRRTQSDYWQPTVIDLEDAEGVYVKLDRFHPSEFGNSSINRWKDRFEKLNIPWPTIIGFKNTYPTENIPAGFQKLGDFIRESIREKLAQEKPELAIAERKMCAGYVGKLVGSIAHSTDLEYDKSGPLGTVIAHYNEMNHTDKSVLLDAIVDACDALRIPILAPEVSPKYDTNADLEVVFKRYPLLKQVDDENMLTYGYNTWKPILQHYFKLIDGQTVEPEYAI